MSYLSYSTTRFRRIRKSLRGSVDSNIIQIGEDAVFFVPMKYQRQIYGDDGNIVTLCLGALGRRRHLSLDLDNRKHLGLLLRIAEEMLEISREHSDSGNPLSVIFIADKGSHAVLDLYVRYGAEVEIVDIGVLLGCPNASLPHLVKVLGGAEDRISQEDRSNQLTFLNSIVNDQEFIGKIGRNGYQRGIASIGQKESRKRFIVDKLFVPFWSEHDADIVAHNSIVEIVVDRVKSEEKLEDITIIAKEVFSLVFKNDPSKLKEAEGRTNFVRFYFSDREPLDINIIGPIKKHHLYLDESCQATSRKVISEHTKAMLFYQAYQPSTEDTMLTKYLREAMCFNGLLDPTGLLHVIFLGEHAPAENTIRPPSLRMDKLDTLASQTSLKIFLDGQQVDQSQRRATEAALAPVRFGMSDSNRILFIDGPPGTGKSSVIRIIISSYKAVLVDEDEEDCKQNGVVIITSKSNDNVQADAAKLYRSGTDFRIVISTAFMKDGKHKMEKCVRARELKLRNKKGETDDQKVERIKRETKGCCVYLVTMASLQEFKTQFFFRSLKVDLLVVDEASQMNDICIPRLLSLYKDTVYRFVVVGDEKQIGPYSSSRSEVKSIFSYLDNVHRVQQDSMTEVLLNVSYRLKKPICRIISDQVYNSELDSHDQTTEDLADCLHLYFVRGRERGEASRPGSTSKCNVEEAEAVAAFVMRLLNFCGISPNDIAVITPYQAQTDLVKSKLHDSGVERHEYTNMVRCIDGFQGAERHFIIGTLTRSEHLGFLQSQNRQNVMLTRSDYMLFLFLNEEFFTRGRGRDVLVGNFVSENQANVEAGQTDCSRRWELLSSAELDEQLSRFIV